MFSSAGTARNQSGPSSSRFTPARPSTGPALGQSGPSNARQNTRHQSQQEQNQQSQQPIELSDEQREEIREAFELFDLDKDKKIDYHELKVAMKALGFDESKQEVLRILRKYGTPAAPSSSRMLITYEAFAQVMAEKISARDPVEEILRAFSLFAGTAVQTNNGEELRIGVDDLRRVARELGENLEEEEIQAMIREFDLDNDNLISKDEFIAICRGE
ncbi:cell division control protein 31 [Terfezia boudieri ATCC MYA-4762]|uniref:Cell division control protein 31 n=1 Tax=Terfezia boudieri ATCC MYA-4762 TaxID=1051890 RepID=A0A3N4LK29_9PEZI|nr:cell division control protein 31 [Terfezia boudieri ATCC MYA-4762]